ncbi:2-alkenal reductase (NADP(+)-dependent)-like [Pyrus ussuriensis x Pyrus communis]|uniref:2-alkenal reductase (NADP(+)-dependent)-like n=1 Tax=Pyrus ussuriensis x Pyrus communis TaxID=2448454 RepID=A0A5N5GWB9_9ROSA|nr:2-alkenal reductase (NADP(+)-dependent)-like [Pyrus ussuriensis x Pyrus communis]
MTSATNSGLSWGSSTLHRPHPMPMQRDDCEKLGTGSQHNYSLFLLLGFGGCEMTGTSWSVPLQPQSNTCHAPPKRWFKLNVDGAVDTTGDRRRRKLHGGGQTSNLGPSYGIPCNPQNVNGVAHRVARYGLYEQGLGFWTDIGPPWLTEILISESVFA